MRQVGHKPGYVNLLNMEAMKMNGYRKYLLDHPDENMSWCRHYSNGDVSVAINEGEIVGVELNTYDGAPVALTDRVALAARLLAGDEYETYKQYNHTDDDIVIEEIATGANETGCTACPYFEFCEACDNPDGWDDAPESADYPDA